MTAPIRALLLAPGRLFADALQVALSDGPVVVAAATADPEEAVALISSLGPGVVLVHAAAAGPLVIRRLARAGAAPVVALGVVDREEDVLAVLEAGAVGYVLHRASLADAVATIEAVGAGRTVCSPRVLAAVFRRLCELSARGLAAGRGDSLSAREREVMGLIARGLANKQIARTLGIAVCTVKNHVHNLLEKLGVDRRRAAARFASAPPGSHPCSTRP